MGLRSKNLDPYIFLSFVLILLLIVIVFYPILIYYFDTYSKNPKGLHENSQFTYILLFKADFRSAPDNISKLLLDKYNSKTYAIIISINSINLTNNSAYVSYRLVAIPPGSLISVRPVGEGGILISNYTIIEKVDAVERLDEFPLYFLFLPRDNINDNFKIKIEDKGFYKGGLFQLRPDQVLGVPKLYSALWVYIEDSATLNVTLNVSCDDVGCFISYIGFDNDYLLLLKFSADFGILDEANNNAKIFSHYILLKYLEPFNHTTLYFAVNNYPEIFSNDYVLLALDTVERSVPEEQAWLEFAWFRFNSLFPVSYAMIVGALILLIVRVRKWQ
ncbi:MAG: hypothetical protein GXO43_10205 [Crenarchaeota archaeon]|nr:hypothetical protein [Thermoproteota archaeon]